ncbi:MAG: SAM-dependent methyltransferase [Nocardioides sp.]|nr:SAM-dependent methyltransferase [Nocardioides sp.]
MPLRTAAARAWFPEPRCGRCRSARGRRRSARSRAAGESESNIRRWIIENDWLEAVVALPDQMFYNTGINTYFWVVTNRKRPERRGKVALVDARSMATKMRKSLGNKRNHLTDDSIDELTRLYTDAPDLDDARVKATPWVILVGRGWGRNGVGVATVNVDVVFRTPSISTPLGAASSVLVMIGHLGRARRGGRAWSRRARGGSAKRVVITARCPTPLRTR